MFYEIDNELIQQENMDVNAHWFRDTQVERDLFVWKDDHGGIDRVQLAYSDVVVEWDEKNGIRTGRLSDIKTKLSSSQIFTFHDSPNERIMRYVRRIMRRFECTDEDVTAFMKKTFVEDE